MEIYRRQRGWECKRPFCTVAAAAKIRARSSALELPACLQIQTKVPFSERQPDYRKRLPTLTTTRQPVVLLCSKALEAVETIEPPIRTCSGWRCRQSAEGR